MSQGPEREPADALRPAKDRAPTPEEQATANQLIGEALRDLQYGQVTVTVQDGVIVQVDRLERWRTGS
jgi:hypothetical protein